MRSLDRRKQRRKESGRGGAAASLFRPDAKAIRTRPNLVTVYLKWEDFQPHSVTDGSLDG